jgi:hypothetical protein
VTAHTARVLPLCVRCGRFSRAGALFICGACQADPKARREIDLLMRAGGTHTDQRRLAIERFHWAGGWGRT